MKILIGNEGGAYTFNPAARTITLGVINSGGREITPNLGQLLLITNVTRNIMLYNFADPTLGATLTGDVITLNYNTVAMSSTDVLQIFLEVDDQTTELLTLFQRLIKMSECLGMVDSSNRQRVSIDFAPSLTVSAVTAITNPVTIANISLIGGLDPRFNYIDIARTAYEIGIRSKLTWTA